MSEQDPARFGRRNLLKAFAALPAAAAAPAVLANIPSVPQGFDEAFDVIVVGSGFAGLAAAAAAAEKGAQVLVIEKMPIPGGNSLLSGGMMAIPGSKLQAEQGIKDSPQELEADMTRIGLGLGDPAHIRYVCEHANEAFEWTKSFLGVQWGTELTGKGGHSEKRCLITTKGTGIGIIEPALKKLQELGVQVRTSCFMQTIVRGAHGRVTGLVVREGYEFGKAGSGREKLICARRGVVLAFGGFGADVAYRARLDPKLGSKFLTTNQVGATAEAWREASRAGARIIQADWIQCLPSCSPKETGMGIATHFASISASLFGFWFSSLTGHRFVNEFGDRKLCTDAILNIINKGGKALAFADQDGANHLESLRPGLLAKMLEQGTVKKYADATALCQDYQVDEKELRAQIARYNTALESGLDGDYRRPFDKQAKPISDGPYYVSEMSPKVHHCMGGMATGVDTSVLDVMTDHPIPGLYAAGECVGGIHGAVRIGACAVMDCLVNGRKAGQMAAQSSATGAVLQPVAKKM